jgi:hypothetical protein
LLTSHALIARNPTKAFGPRSPFRCQIVNGKRAWYCSAASASS